MVVVLLCFMANPKDIYTSNSSQDYNVDTVYTNHDYEPYATARDTELKSFLGEHNIEFKTYKDQVIFEKSLKS